MRGDSVLLEKYAKGTESTAGDVQFRVANALASVEANPREWEQRFLGALKAGFIFVRSAIRRIRSLWESAAGRTPMRGRSAAVPALVRRLRCPEPIRIIAARNGGPCRFPAANTCEPRQARKGATVAATSRAGGRLAGVATLDP